MDAFTEELHTLYSGYAINPVTPRFFSSFTSLSELQHDVRALIMKPFIGLSCILIHLIHTLRSLVITTINLLLLDFASCQESLATSGKGFFTTAVMAGMVLQDTLHTLLVFVSRVLGTGIHCVLASAPNETHEMEQDRARL